MGPTLQFRWERFNVYLSIIIHIFITRVFFHAITLAFQSSSRIRPFGLEDRINRAKAKVKASTSSAASPSKPKLSSRFHSAQKLNNKFLSNLSAGVKRSRTFNISSVDAMNNDDLMGAIGSSLTLPNGGGIRGNKTGNMRKKRYC